MTGYGSGSMYSRPAYGGTNPGSMYGGGAYGTSGGMYGSTPYGGVGMGSYGGSYGAGGMYGNSYGGGSVYGRPAGGGMYGGGGGMYGAGAGVYGGGGGMYGQPGLLGGGAVDPNNPHAPPQPPSGWQAMLAGLGGLMHFFGRLSFLVDENAHAVHFFVSALLQLLDRAGSLYGELARFILRILGIRRGKKAGMAMRVLAEPGLEVPGGGDPAKYLASQEAFWKAMRRRGPKPRAPTVVRTTQLQYRAPVDYDVAVAGGTLGIFLATALQLRGLRVVVVERGEVLGRTQEWNISRAEVQTLVRAGVLTPGELEEAIVSEFNPTRVAVHGAPPIAVRDVLNVGVCPRTAVECARRRFEAAGGRVLERTTVRGAVVHPNAVALETSPTRTQSPATSVRGDEGDLDGGGDANGGTDKHSGAPSPSAAAPRLAASLLIDTMGHWSPIVAQLRRGARPDRVVMVVGGCVGGVPPAANQAGDLLATLGDAADDMQLFWEAFPARDGGRTLYAFAYVDAHPDRPDFAQVLERYLAGIPSYQGQRLEDLRFRRLLLAAFPCYPDASPLKPGFDRILQVGDAAASQSPLSFGGFGSMVRHLPRLAQGVEQAVRCDRLSRAALGWLQPSSPTLSSAWLFQGAMAPRDTLLFLPLSATMAGMALRDPGTILRVVRQLGPGEVLRWGRHYLALGLATLLDALLWPLREQLRGSYRWRRMLDAVHWGSGADYYDH